MPPYRVRFRTQRETGGESCDKKSPMRVTVRKHAGCAESPSTKFRKAAMTAFKLAVAAASAVLLALAIPPSYAQDKAKLAKGDAQSLRQMARADLAEIEAGKVAAEKATHPEVKKYGQHMVDEHSKMLEEGKKLAESKGMKPPAAPAKKHQAALKKLQEASGADFDRRYMRQMVQDHEEALKLVEKAAKDAKDPELKAHAQKGAPHIKEHLAMARKIRGALK
jgi:putative membrane protein